MSSVVKQIIYNLIIIIMNEQKNGLWTQILKIAITILTAIATTLGVQACA